LPGLGLNPLEEEFLAAGTDVDGFPGCRSLSDADEVSLEFTRTDFHA
jgi:hypothetical protein